MMTLERLTFLAMLLVVPANAGAADFAPAVVPPQLDAVCPAPFHSSLPVSTQPRPASLLIEVETRYTHAIEVSRRESVVFSPSQAYTWAEATKLSCGKAIGFLRSHEFNALQVHECDCFYRRMVAHLR